MSQTFVLVNCSIHAKNVKEKLMRIPGIKEVNKVFGAYDYIVKTEDVQKLETRKRIRKTISDISDVRSTLTLNKTY